MDLKIEATYSSKYEWVHPMNEMNRLGWMYHKCTTDVPYMILEIILDRFVVG